MSDFDNTSGDDVAPRRGTEKKSNKTCMILGIIGGVILAGVLCCGGFSYFGWNAAMGVLEDAVKVELAANPVAQQHLGDITSVDVNLTKTGETNKPGFLVFDVVGTKGSGQVSVRQNPGDEAHPLTTEDGELRMSNGDVFSLDGEAGHDIELGDPTEVPGLND